MDLSKLAEPFPPGAERFWRQVDRSGGCWVWLGCKNGSGYGSYAGQMAHRYVHNVLIGPIPSGMVVMHCCDQPICVNPEHLRLGTQADNLADMTAKGHRVSGPRGPRCRKGHEYTVANTYWRPSGPRRCRACDRERHACRRVA